MPWSEERRARQMATLAQKKDADTMVAETNEISIEERAQRALDRRSGRNSKTLTPLEQIRPYDQTGVPDHSAACYFLRPDGATIGDILIYYPNGAVLSRREDPRGHYSQDHEYHRAKLERKGFEYVGPTLTREGARRMVQIMAGNRDDEIERLEDEIALCQYTIQNTDRPDVRDQQRARRDQFQTRLDRVRAPLDADALVDELSEIARAQKMANINPDILEVMQEMVGEQNAKFTEMVAKFTRAAPAGTPAAGDDLDALA